MIALIFFFIALCSLWIRKDPKIWGPLLALSWALGLQNGFIQPIGLLILLGSAFFWVLYTKAHSFSSRLFLFIFLIALSFAFVFHQLPGFQSIPFTPKFALGLEKPSFCFFPLALFVPLAQTSHDWKKVWEKGVPLSLLGVASLAVVAVLAGVVHLHFKWPSFAAYRYASNFFLTAIPEEAFYRGFLQKGLSSYFQNGKRGNLVAFLLATLLFTFAHVYWSPDLATLVFVFIAGLLYGGVYWATGKIESAIFCHFLLNFTHMTFFTYHAM